MALFMCIGVALAVFTIINCCQQKTKEEKNKKSDQNDHEMTVNEGHRLTYVNEGVVRDARIVQ